MVGVLTGCLDLCKRVLAQTTADNDTAVKRLEARTKVTLSTLQRFSAQFDPSKPNALVDLRNRLLEVNNQVTAHRLQSHLKRCVLTEQRRETFEKLERLIIACLEDLPTALVDAHAKAKADVDQAIEQLAVLDRQLTEPRNREDETRTQIMQCVSTMKTWLPSCIQELKGRQTTSPTTGLCEAGQLALERLEELLHQARSELIRDLYDSRELLLPEQGYTEVSYPTFQLGLGLEPKPRQTSLAALGEQLPESFEYDDLSDDEDGDHESSCIGEGDLGRVYRMRCKADGKKYAVKVLRKARAAAAGLEASQLLVEVNNLAVLDHPNIVGYFGHYEDKKGKSLFIVTELMEGGALHEVFNPRASLLLPLERVSKWTSQLCSALDHMHSIPMIHRDLKLSNLFLTAGDDLKLGDLGLASTMGMRSMLSSMRGNEAYRSPEKARGERYNEKDDLWAAGAILSELLTGRTLVQRCQGGEACFAKNEEAVRTAVAESLNRSAHLGSLVSALLDPVPHKRLSAAQVLQRLGQGPSASGLHPAIGALETLTKEDADFHMVQELIRDKEEAAHGRMIVVEEVQRVTNSMLEQRFREYQRQVREQRGPSKSVGLKFHGTTQTSAVSIVQSGFQLPSDKDEQGRFLSADQRVLPLRDDECLGDCEEDFKRFLLMGGGIYFATSSTKASLFTKGSDCMLLCELECGRSQQRLSECFTLSGKALGAEGYDSVFVPACGAGGFGTSSEEFVVYTVEAALPRFLIKFRTTALRTVEYHLSLCSLARALDALTYQQATFNAFDVEVAVAIFQDSAPDGEAQVSALEQLGNMSRDCPQVVRRRFAGFRDKLLDRASSTANEAVTWHCLRVLANVFLTAWDNAEAKSWASGRLPEVACFLVIRNHAVVQKATIALNNLLLTASVPTSDTAKRLVQSLMTAFTKWDEPMTQLYIISALRNFAVTKQACCLLKPHLHLFLGLLPSASRHPDWLRWTLTLLNNMMIEDKGVGQELMSLGIERHLKPVLASAAASHPETLGTILKCLLPLVPEMTPPYRQGLVATVCAWIDQKLAQQGMRTCFTKPGDLVCVLPKGKVQGKVCFGPDKDGDFAVEVDGKQSFFTRSDFGVLWGSGCGHLVPFYEVQLLFHMSRTIDVSPAFDSIAASITRATKLVHASSNWLMIRDWASRILLNSSEGRHAILRHGLDVADLEDFSFVRVAHPSLKVTVEGLSEWA